MVAHILTVAIHGLTVVVFFYTKLIIVALRVLFLVFIPFFIFGQVISSYLMI